MSTCLCVSWQSACVDLAILAAEACLESRRLRGPVGLKSSSGSCKNHIESEITSSCIFPGACFLYAQVHTHHMCFRSPTWLRPDAPCRQVICPQLCRSRAAHNCATIVPHVSTSVSLSRFCLTKQLAHHGYSFRTRQPSVLSVRNAHPPASSIPEQPNGITISAILNLNACCSAFCKRNRICIIWCTSPKHGTRRQPVVQGQNKAGRQQAGAAGEAVEG